MRKFFSKSAYRQCLRRYWAGSALLALILSMAALSYYQSISHGYYTATNPQPYYETPGISSAASAAENEQKQLEQTLLNRLNAADNILDQLPGFAGIAIAAAVFCALLVFSFMHHKRASVMMHSLPIRREAHFLSSYLGGLTLLAAPILLCAIELALAQFAAGCFNFGILSAWLLLMLLAALTAYSLTVFAGYLTGHSIAQFTVAALIVALPIFFELFLRLQAANYLFGSDLNNHALAANLAYNPLVLLTEQLGRASNWFPEPGKFLITGHDVASLMAALLLSLVLSAAALWLARKRKLECAGDFIAVRGMRPVFRYGSAFLMALLFGFFGLAVYHDDIVAFTIFALLGGVLGFFIAEMFIRKAVRVLRYWKGAALFVICYLVLLFSFQLDLFGYGRYVLPADQVESIYLSESYYSPYGYEHGVNPYPGEFTEGAGFDAALALQRKIAEQGRNYRTTNGWSGNYYEFYHRYYYLHAKLKNGKVVTRTYKMVLPTTFTDWDAELNVIQQETSQQRTEYTRNLGSIVKQVSFHFPYDWSTLNRENEARMTRQELIELFQHLALDNVTDYADTPSILVIYAEIGSDREWYNTHYTVTHEHTNTVNWLLERNYLTQTMLDQFQDHIDEQKRAEEEAYTMG